MMTHNQFIKKFIKPLRQYWDHISTDILEWRNSFQWPVGTNHEESIKIRNELENLIKEDLAKSGYVTKEVFDEVMKWGFGSPSRNSEAEIINATKEAFEYLHQNEIEEAARSLTKLPNIGISRASKILALSDQDKLGIYDSRSADGLSDLVINNKRLIPIPPGRAIQGDLAANFHEGFRNYIYVISYLHQCASKFSNLRENFKKVADIEIALFARSRNKNYQVNNYRPSKYLYKVLAKNTTAIDEGDCFWTLSKGKKAKQFWAIVDEKGIKILTGEDADSIAYLNNEEIKRCFVYFSDQDWFPLGNNITKIDPGGLGEYFKEQLKKSPKYASHYSAIWVSQRKLIYRYGLRNRIELKTTE